MSIRLTALGACAFMLGAAVTASGASRRFNTGRARRHASTVERSRPGVPAPCCPIDASSSAPAPPKRKQSPCVREATTAGWAPRHTR